LRRPKKFHNRTEQEEGRASERKFPQRLRHSAASGARAVKGDWQDDEILVECKHTTQQSFRITVEMLEKLHTEAAQAGKIPVLEITIGDYQVVAAVWRAA